MARGAATIARLFGVVCLLVAVGVPVAADGASSTERTTISITVKHCDACRIQALRFDHVGNLLYASRFVPVRDGSARVVVPTDQTRKMSFAVRTPFDDYGLPLVAVVGYLSRNPDDPVAASYVRGTHQASACWAGTDQPRVEETLVITRHRGHLAYGEGHGTVAGAYFKTTLPTLPYFVGVFDGSYHVGDPSMCA